MTNYQLTQQNDGGRVSSCGGYIIMANGKKFKRTVLPSVAEPKQEEVIDIEAALAEADLIRTQESDAVA